MRRHVPRQEPARCTCEPGPNAAQHHAKPGAKVADHGNPFAGTGCCVHSDMQRTTRPLVKRPTITRLRF